MKAFGDVETFLANTDLPSITTGKLLGILSDPAKARKLRIEIAVTVDTMEPFVKATYKLEGDGALSLVAYDHSLNLCIDTSFLGTQYYSTSLRLSYEMFLENSHLTSYGLQCSRPIQLFGIARA